MEFLTKVFLLSKKRCVYEHAILLMIWESNKIWSLLNLAFYSLREIDGNIVTALWHTLKHSCCDRRLFPRPKVSPGTFIEHMSILFIFSFALRGTILGFIRICLLSNLFLKCMTFYIFLCCKDCYDMYFGVVQVGPQSIDDVNRMTGYSVIQVDR